MDSAPKDVPAVDPAVRCVVMLLHGLTMRPAVLQPFAESLAPVACTWVPAGPVVYPDGSRSWWPVDLDKRVARLAAGPVDLADRSPAGRLAAHAALDEALAEARSAHPGLPIVLAGFSQGGMLALDWWLLGQRSSDVHGLVLLSSSRIALSEWQPQLHRLAGLPVLVAHGRQDQDLAFAAGEGLHRMLLDAGARVHWLPFDGGHELPLVVWRGLRRFVLDHWGP
jgi:phospholipase/carboxylesterase